MKIKCPKKYKRCGCYSWADRPKLQKIYHKYNPGQIFTNRHGDLIIGNWDYKTKKLTVIGSYA